MSAMLLCLMPILRDNLCGMSLEFRKSKGNYGDQEGDKICGHSEKSQRVG